MRKEQTAATKLAPALIGLLFAAALPACAEEAPPAESPTYEVHYQAALLPETGLADVTIRVTQSANLLRVLDFNAPANRYRNFSGEGELTVEADRVLWDPPATGGSLQYTVAVDRLRGNVFEARLTEHWAVFRLGHLFPPARVRTRAGAAGRATLSITGPTGWRFESPYGPTNRTVHHVDSDRLFPRPVGWAIAGELGVRRDRIADRRIAVAAPVGETFRRQDTLAFLRWTLPELVEVFPSFPERLLVVGSGRDMWRGGLSGPASLYLHPDRPLISGNATSTLLHELIHVAIGSTPSNSDDWLVEGLAEYYSLTLLRRSGAISNRRFSDTIDWLSEWVRTENGRFANPSTGADTARAVLALHELAVALEAAGHSLDTLVGQLLTAEQITGAALRERLSALGVTTAQFDDAP